MFVKRIILAVATMLLVAASVSAQDYGGRKLTKKERKALQERMDSLANAEAQKAIDDTGVPTRMCLFHGENHELSRSGKPKHRIRRLREITSWFDHYLKGEPSCR